MAANAFAAPINVEGRISQLQAPNLKKPFDNELVNIADTLSGRWELERDADLEKKLLEMETSQIANAYNRQNNGILLQRAETALAKDQLENDKAILDLIVRQSYGTNGDISQVNPQLTDYMVNNRGFTLDGIQNYVKFSHAQLDNELKGTKSQQVTPEQLVSNNSASASPLPNSTAPTTTNGSVPTQLNDVTGTVPSSTTITPPTKTPQDQVSGNVPINLSSSVNTVEPKVGMWGDDLNDTSTNITSDQRGFVSTNLRNTVEELREAETLGGINNLKQVADEKFAKFNEHSIMLRNNQNGAILFIPNNEQNQKQLERSQYQWTQITDSNTFASTLNAINDRNVNLFMSRGLNKDGDADLVNPVNMINATKMVQQTASDITTISGQADKNNKLRRSTAEGQSDEEKQLQDVIFATDESGKQKQRTPSETSYDKAVGLAIYGMGGISKANGAISQKSVHNAIMSAYTPKKGEEVSIGREFMDATVEAIRLATKGMTDKQRFEYFSDPKNVQKLWVHLNEGKKHYDKFADFFSKGSTLPKGLDTENEGTVQQVMKAFFAAGINVATGANNTYLEERVYEGKSQLRFNDAKFGNPKDVNAFGKYADAVAIGTSEGQAERNSGGAIPESRYYNDSASRKAITSGKIEPLVKDLKTSYSNTFDKYPEIEAMLLSKDITQLVKAYSIPDLPPQVRSLISKIAERDKGVQEEIRNNPNVKKAHSDMIRNVSRYGGLEMYTGDYYDLHGDYRKVVNNETANILSKRGF